jgi:hypothetical protein
VSTTVVLPACRLPGVQSLICNGVSTVVPSLRRREARDAMRTAP